MKKTIFILLVMLLTQLYAVPTTETTARKGMTLQLTGDLIEVGDKAPIVSLVSSNMKKVRVGGVKKKIEIIVVVPSLDTPVCDMEARTFNDKAAHLKDVHITIVSMDLPFAGKRYCAAHGIENITIASDFQTKNFGRQYGVLIDNSIVKGLLTRAIFIVKDGRIVYKQLVPEITHQPDYDAVFDALKKLDIK